MSQASRSSSSSSSAPSPVSLQIQPPLLATPHRPLFPPLTVLLAKTLISPFDPANSNFVTIACAIPADAHAETTDESPLSGEVLMDINHYEEHKSEIVQASRRLSPSISPDHKPHLSQADVMNDTRAVSGTPFQDGEGVALVFRSLTITEHGEWKVKIVVLQMSSEGGEAKCCAEAVSTVIRVGEDGGGSESERVGNFGPEEQRFLDSLGV